MARVHVTVCRKWFKEHKINKLQLLCVTIFCLFFLCENYFLITQNKYIHSLLGAWQSVCLILAEVES